MRLRTLFEIVISSGCSNASITFDCLHFYRSGGTVRDLEAWGSEKLGRVSNIQLCDVSLQIQPLSWREKLAANRALITSVLDGVRTMGFKSMVNASSKAHSTRGDAAALMKEAICARLLPGEGDIPLSEILETFNRLGCYPLLGLEIFSLSLNKLSAQSAAQQAMISYKRIAN